jgi:DTW domain-containing protein YfiP
VNTSIHTPRPVCAGCKRPPRSCVCQWVRPTLHVVEVLVLQHPMEVNNAKGSARLLQMSLLHSKLLSGEVFAPAELQQLLTAPWDSSAQPQCPKHALLLYPNTPEDLLLGLLRPAMLSPELLKDPTQLRLVVLDGTWRKSRKMLYLNPLLQQLPRLALHDMPVSRYRIRKAQGGDQRSTLEATCAALAQLEHGHAQQFEPLLDAFDGFVAQRWELAHQFPLQARP